MFDFLNPYMLGIKIAGIALAVATLVSVGAYGGYRWELGEYNGLVAADAKALQIATADAKDKQHTIDLANQKDAVADAYFKGQLAGTVVNIISGAPANVTITQDAQAAAADHAGCVTYGFARMLYAGAHGVTPDSLQLPDGQSVDSCTGLEPSVLATEVAQDLASGYGNGHQLNELIVATKRNDALAQAAKK